MGPEESLDLNNVIENSLDALVQNESEDIPYPEKHSVSLFECRADVSGGDGKVHDQSTPTTIDHEVVDESHGPDATVLSFSSPGHTNSDSSSVRYHQTDVSGALTSCVQGSEPIYEGEECVLDTRTGNFEDREPVYEEQSDKSTLAAPDLRAKDELTPEQGKVVPYIEEEFKVENHESSTWDENNALTSTATTSRFRTIASIDSATHASLDINSDLQLAIALQQLEAMPIVYKGQSPRGGE
ncbi:hypothetical protein JHK85_039135 [Glycine max]|nr:hypothetical protein JHK85_039135 [Glycine max]